MLLIRWALISFICFYFLPAMAQHTEPPRKSLVNACVIAVPLEIEPMPVSTDAQVICECEIDLLLSEMHKKGYDLKMSQEEWENVSKYFAHEGKINLNEIMAQKIFYIEMMRIALLEEANACFNKRKLQSDAKKWKRHLVLIDPV